MIINGGELHRIRSVLSQRAGLSIPVTEELLKASLWRLDPLNEACDVIICEMILRDNGIAIKSFSEREISEGIKTTSGIAEYSLDAQGLLLCV